MVVAMEQIVEVVQIAEVVLVFFMLTRVVMIVVLF